MELKFLVFFALSVPCIFAENRIHPLQTFMELHHNKEPRIIFGELAKPGEYPWQVGIEYTADDLTYICGGSLIHTNFVLTAAHCTVGVKEFKLRFGSVKFFEGGIERMTKKSYKHEDYDPETLFKDIAIIYFEKAVPLSDTIKTIRLPKMDEILGDNENLIVTGFGYTAYGPGEELYTIPVNSISFESCRHFYSNLERTQVCCTGKQGKSTCQGDSGGPLVKITEKDKVLVGIVSFTHKAGCMNHLPFGFTRTQPYVRWIKNAMKKFMN